MAKHFTINNKTRTSPELDEILRVAPESRIVKPEIVGKDNLTRHIGNLLSCHDVPPVERVCEDYRRYQEAVERYGLTIRNERAFLKPVTDLQLFYCDNGRYKREDGTPCLVHFGRFIGSKVPFSKDETPFDNIINLRRFGVFGNPSEQHPTYLQRPDAHMTLYGDSVTDVCIHVDVKKLLELRSVFIDPETIDAPDVLSHEKLGTSYFIVGGIPKEAIFSYLIITEAGRHPYPKDL